MTWTLSHRIQRFFAFAWIALFAGRCVADDWSLTTADFQTEQVQLRTLGSDGVGVTSADSKAQHTVLLNDFVSIHRTGTEDAATPAFTLTMVNGDRYVGAPGSVIHEKLTWNSPTLGAVMVPLGKLALISRGLNLLPMSESPKQDVVTLSNGDTVAGVFTDCVDLKITLQTDAGSSTLPLETIRQIAFAPTGAAVTNSGHGYRLHLADASIVTAVDASLYADQVTLTLPGKEAVKISLPIGKVVAIEQINGPVGWLSSQAPAEEIQTPYLGGAAHWPARFDLAVDGSPLSFDGQVYDHGIGVHAYSRLTFAIDPQWTVFRTQYAIDSHRDEPRRYADVTVRILLDGQIVHEEKNFREGVLSPVVKLDLNGAKMLTLECDYGNTGDTQAHLDWLQPAFVLVASPTSAPTSQP